MAFKPFFMNWNLMIFCSIKRRDTIKNQGKDIHEMIKKSLYYIIMLAIIAGCAGIWGMRKIDSEREIAPLRKAPDALLVDNTDLDITQTLEKLLGIVKSRIMI